MEDGNMDEMRCGDCFEPLSECECMIDDDGTPRNGWEMVGSIDHGLRTADETMALECAYIADMVMRPVLRMLCPTMWPDDIDAWGAVVEEMGSWSGDGWAKPTDDDPNCERVHWVHDDIVFHARWGSVEGIAWETSADAGMTWMLAKTSA